MGAFTYYVIRRRGKSGVSKILMHDYGGLLGGGGRGWPFDYIVK